jgi:hypothetical protein
VGGAVPSALDCPGQVRRVKAKPLRGIGYLEACLRCAAYGRRACGLAAQRPDAGTRCLSNCRSSRVLGRPASCALDRLAAEAHVVLAGGDTVRPRIIGCGTIVVSVAWSRTVTVPGAVAGQRARFRAVISADRQSFALRRLSGIVTTVNTVILIVGDIVAVTAIIAGITLIAPSRSQNVPLGITYLTCGLLMLWVLVHLYFRRPLVWVTRSELCARGLLGVTHKAQRSEIVSIDLRAKAYGREVTATRVPYARKTGGGGFWLDALAGDTERRPPDPAQLEVLRQLRATLNVTGSEWLGASRAQAKGKLTHAVWIDARKPGPLRIRPVPLSDTSTTSTPWCSVDGQRGCW